MASVMKGLQGGLGGAASGAAIGSVIPGIGTAIGALGGGIIGGLGGLFGGDDDKAQMPAISSPVSPEQIAQAQAQTQSGLAQQQAFLAALQAQNGIGNQSQVYNQLQGVAQGTGPNPAQAALQQATGQNVANQAALMASQRGAGANAGLIARQAAQQGAAIQQNAVGQAATLQAQQQLAAMQAAGNIAGQQVGQQANALGNYNQFALGNQGQLLGAQGAYNSALTGAQSNANSVNQGYAQMNANQVGGLLNGAGAAATAIAGGMAREKGNNGAPTTNTTSNGPQMVGSPTKAPQAPAMAHGGQVPGPSSFVGRHMMSEGGTVKTMLSPGELYIAPSKLNAADPVAAGVKIPGQAKVKGDSKKNDTVPADLQEGGIVVPRTKMQDHEAASKFVQAILAKQGMRK